MDTLSIYIITWNVATKFPEENLMNLLNISKNNDSLPDFYIVGLQEVKSQPQNFVMDAIFNDPWTNAFRNALAPYNYVKVKTCRLVGLLLNIFCLRKHLIHLRDIYVEHTKTGLLGFWGNKGAITVRLQIYGCSLCFVNCHLAAHDESVKERIDDYNTILQGQKFTVRDTASILFHDYVFWFGDLNFRLNGEATLSAEEIIKQLKRGNISSLLRYDQLKQVMESGEAFSELIENGPEFYPTYRTIVHSQEYDAKRRPAWTDRILFKVNKDAYENVTLDVQQLSYKSHEKYSVSDHKPVTSELVIKVFSNYLEKQVKLTPLDNWYTEKENQVSVRMESDISPSMWDWIGIYQANFVGLDEYVHYVYLPSVNGLQSAPSNNAAGTDNRENTDTYSVNVSYSNDGREAKYVLTFPDTAIRVPGSYRLLYITQNSENVLGMSEPFVVQETLDHSRPSLDW